MVRARPVPDSTAVHAADLGAAPADAIRGDATRAAKARTAQLTEKHIRGSSLLLSGRVVALGIKLVAQLAMVRYLTTAEYGSWAQVLALLTLLGAFSSLSLDRGLTRFASIFHERREYDRFFGALLLVTGTIVMSAVVFVLALYAFPMQALGLLGGSAATLALLFILIFMVPLDALDQVCTSAFATLGHAGTIFFRKYLLGPLLQLGAVLLTLLLRADITFLAIAYLSATCAGLLINGLLLVRTFRREGLLAHFHFRRITLPARPMFSFALPSMTTDWLEVLIHSSGALILGYVASTEQVAAFRVVVPLALLTQVVIRSFDVLYVPTASRLFANGDRAGITAVYRRTALWVAVAAFPIFAVTFTAATPLTVLLYGVRYESSGAVLALLALGIYVKAALSFGSATLKVLGEVRLLAGCNLLAAGANVLLNVVLVPRFGVMGAAGAMSATVALDAVLKHEALRRACGHSLMAGPERRLYVVLLGVVTTLAVARSAGPDQSWLLWLLPVIASGLVLWFSRAMLGIEDVFPEVRRMPLLRLITR